VWTSAFLNHYQADHSKTMVRPLLAACREFCHYFAARLISQTLSCHAAAYGQRFQVSSHPFCRIEDRRSGPSATTLDWRRTSPVARCMTVEHEMKGWNKSGRLMT
jgi:hypothetical protein